MLAQTCAVSEIIVIDDGSSDGTSDEIRNLVRGSREAAQRLRYYYQRNQGKSVALNHALGKVRGEWVAFLDSDDFWLPEKLEWQLRALRKYQNECSACFTDACFINDPNLKLTALELAGRRCKQTIGMISDPVRFILGGSGVWVQTLLVRTDTLCEVGGFDSNLRVGEDTDFVFRLALKARFCFVNLPLVSIDRSPNQRESLTELMFQDECFHLSQMQILYKKWLALSPGLDRGAVTQIRALLADIYNQWGNRYLREAEYENARLSLSQAVQLRSRLRLRIKLTLARLLPAWARRIALKRAAHSQRKPDFTLR